MLSKPSRAQATRWIPATVLALTALLLLAPSTFAAEPAQPSPSPPASSDGAALDPSQTATFGIGPADTERIDGRPDLTFYASPGATARDQVGLVNLSTRSLNLEVYVAEASNAADGMITFAPRAAEFTDAGTWLKVETPSGTSTVTVPPRTTTIVPVVAKLPADAEPGDHAAGIVVSLTTTSQREGEVGQRIDLEQRVATRVFFRVSGPLRPELTVENLNAAYEDNWNPIGAGSATVTYRIRNTGNVRLVGTQSIEVTGLFKDVAVEGPLVSLLLPGGSFDVSERVPEVWPQFRMAATVRVTPITAASGDLNPVLKQASATTNFWAVPWVLLAILVIAGLSWRIRRWRRSRAGAQFGIRRDLRLASDGLGTKHPPLPVPQQQVHRQGLS